MFVIALLEELIEAGHRALIFSQSRVMLDILQAAIQDRGYAFCRIDGSIASTAERQVPSLVLAILIWDIVRQATMLHRVAIRAAYATWPAANGADDLRHGCSHICSLLMPTPGTTCAAAAGAGKIITQSLLRSFVAPFCLWMPGTQSACCLRP